MSKEIYRHEKKYLISQEEVFHLNQRFQSILSKDKHAQTGAYTIRSLYFDDYWNSAYQEKEAGLLLRKKYRIRIYNFSDRIIKLERKKKYGADIYKEDAPLSRQELESILSGEVEFLLHSPHSLCREFYVEYKSHFLRPRLIVDYERIPWIFDQGTVRLTFDSNVRAALAWQDFFDPDLPTLPLLEAGKLVYEVKYTEFLPQIIKELLPASSSEFLAVSKYVLAYEKTAYLHGDHYWFETD